MVVLLLITRVMIPIAKEAKSTAFDPLMIEVEAALVQGTAGGAAWWIKGKSLFCLGFADTALILMGSVLRLILS